MNSMSKRVWFVGAAAVVLGIGGSLVIACGDDTATPTTETDAGGGTDTSVAKDTGSATDTGGGDTATGRTGTVTIAPFGTGTTAGSGTFTEDNGSVTFKLDVTGAVPGSRGTHVHVRTNCTPGAGEGFGPHFNPDPATRNGEWDNIQVDDAGVGHLTSTRAGLTLEAHSDAGPGIKGRVIAVHGIPPTYPDGGPVLSDGGGGFPIGAPLPPPIMGCGVIQ